MNNGMICWTVVSEKKSGYFTNSSDWDMAAATFEDGIAVLIQKDRRKNGRGLFSDSGLVASFWEADIHTGYVTKHIGTTDIPEYWADDIRSSEDLKNICISIKQKYDNKNCGFYAKLKMQEYRYAERLIQKYKGADTQDIC